MKFIDFDDVQEIIISYATIFKSVNLNLSFKTIQMKINEQQMFIEDEEKTNQYALFSARVIFCIYTTINNVCLYIFLAI